MLICYKNFKKDIMEEIVSESKLTQAYGEYKVSINQTGTRLHGKT